MGLTMTEVNQAMSEAIERQGEKLAGNGQSFEAENFFMMASLAGRTLNGENREIAGAVRTYLADTYGVRTTDARTVMLGDPVQKAVPPNFGGKMPEAKPDDDAVQRQRQADRG